jgi:hypothetical protein
MRFHSLLVVLLAVALPTVAHAQDPKFEFGKQEEVKDVRAVEWKAAAQAGLIFTSGNSNTQTFSAGATASRKEGDNKLSLDVSAAYGKSEIRVAVDRPTDVGTPNAGLVGADEIQSIDTVPTNFYLIKGRYDRFLTERNALFVSARVGADKVAGKSLVAGGQLGYSRLLFKDAVHELAAEAGYDFSHELYEADIDSLIIHSARLFAGYTATLTKDTSVAASVEWLTNLNAEDDAPNDEDGDGNVASTEPGELGVGAFRDNRVLGKAALTTKLTEDISFRFGFTAKLDSAPAPLPVIAGSGGYEAGFLPIAEELDTLTEAQLIINLI